MLKSIASLRSLGVPLKSPKFCQLRGSMARQFSLDCQKVTIVPPPKESSLFPAHWEYAMEGSVMWPSNLLERSLEVLHNVSGLPWSLTIVSFAVGMRVALLPLTVQQLRGTVLSNNLKPEIQARQAEVQRLRQEGDVEKSRHKLRELSSFMAQNGVNPIKMLFLALAPAPIFMTSFFALKNMASQPLASLTTEGLLWFTNLTVPDPYYLLPALSTCALLGSLELARFSNPSANMSPMFKIGLRVCAALSFPIMCFMPSALVLYFSTSNLLTCLTQGLLAIPGVRRVFNIPPLQHRTVSPVKVSFLETFKESYKAHLRDSETKSMKPERDRPHIRRQKPSF